MFHRNRNTSVSRDVDSTTTTRQPGFFGRFRGRPSHPVMQAPVPVHHMTVAPQYGPQGVARDYYRDPYYEGSTRSDWDHYAVRHEEALIGDPIPILARDNLNLAAQQAWANQQTGPYGNGPLAQGPVNHGYDDMHYNKRHPAFDGLDKRGNPLVGPVVANGPLAGNLSTGTVVERNLVKGPGRRTRTGFVDDAPYGGREWMSTAWGGDELYSGGAAPLYGNRAPGKYGGSIYGPGGNQGHWGSAPLWGYRDGREYGQATPLLPDNPWTHNELGRDWSDGYRRGTLPYSSINNSYTQAPVTETFVNYGPNGERIEGYRTRTVREDILPPLAGLGQTTDTHTTKSVRDTVTPGVASSMTPRVAPRMPIPADSVIPADAVIPIDEVVRDVSAPEGEIIEVIDIPAHGKPKIAAIIEPVGTNVTVIEKIPSQGATTTVVRPL